jgi:hypothetical protein
MNNFVNSKKIFKSNPGSAKKLENKYVIFKTNIKNIYMKMIISVMFMKKNHYKFGFFAVHEFVLNISFLLLFTKLFTMT